jgi:hypothetical protein
LKLIVVSIAVLTDLTRTGVRSLKGAATDGMNSIRRYLQTFQDDEKQVREKEM